MSEQFIDKSRLNVNNSTNVAAIASLVAAVSIVGNGLHRHPSEFFAWGPEAIGLVAGAFSQWLQGTPSQETKLIKSVLQLEGETNAQLVRSAINRIIGAGVVPGLDRPPVVGDDVGRSGTSPRRSNAVASPQWISSPESIEPNSDRAKSQAAYAADVARGRAASPQRMNELLANSDGENTFSEIVGGGEWQN